MALTESQKLDIAGILELTYVEVNERITWIGSDFTAAVQAKVEEQLDRWTAGAGAKFTRIKANDRNFGAEIDPEREKTDIRKRIAKLLYFDDLNFGGSTWGVGARG